MLLHLYCHPLPSQRMRCMRRSPGMTVRQRATPSSPARSCCRRRRRRGARPACRWRRRPGVRGLRRRRQEPGQDVLPVAGRLRAREGDEHHFISRARIAVPRAMLPDEDAARVSIAQLRAVGEGEAERGGVGAERVVGRGSPWPPYRDAAASSGRRHAGRNRNRASRRTRRPSPRSCSRAPDRCRSRRAR